MNDNLRASQREDRARRTLAATGYRLNKSRVRNPSHPCFERFNVTDPLVPCAVEGIGAFPYEMTLRDVEAFISEEGEE